MTNVTDIIKVDGVLYAGGPNYAAKAPGSLYKSNDGGHTWFGAYAGMSNSGVNSLVAQGSTIYAATPAGIYKTSNGGLNWVGINTGLASAYGYFITADGSMLYLGTQSGVYRSDNQGSNWLASSNGINGYWVNTMLSANTNLYAATPVGLYKSADNGLNWSLINAINIKQGALVADANNVLYALANNGVNKSTNQGQSWQLLTPPNSTNGYPVSASALSSLLIRNNTIYLSAYYEGVYQSNDGGISWQRFGQSTLATIRSMAIVGNNFYFTTGSYTSKTSLDGKQAWISINLPYGTYTNVLVGVENGTDNGILYGLTNQGIYVTTNAGATWTKTSLPSVNVTGLYISGNTYIASTGNGTYVSTNAGNTWALDNEGLNLSSNVYTVVGNQDFLFAGTMAGVYRSTVPTNQ
ncbi:MAG: hypothetical protein HWD59_11485 [Coxiellaceae bacterium]|nr:MAG: hypothetical protein HWD59_11485 [Coxiellaceae bacterium]